MYQKVTSYWSKYLDFMFFDFLSLHISCLIAFVCRYGSLNMYQNAAYQYLAVVFTLMEIIVLVFFESMNHVLNRGYYEEFLATLKHVTTVALFTTYALYILKIGQVISRYVLMLTVVLYFLTSYTSRVLYKNYLHKRMKRGGNRSLLIVTETQKASDIIADIRKNNYQGFHIRGVVIIDSDLVGSSFEGIPVVANRETLTSYVCREWIDEVLIDLSLQKDAKEVANQFLKMGIVVHKKLAQSSETIGDKKFVEQFGNYIVLTSSINCASTSKLLLKRTLDIIGGSIGCIMTGIIFLVIAPLIYIQSPGPIFFTQTRVGKNGKKFKIYKFRSMYMDAEERKKELLNENRVKDGRMFKLDFDPRIIGCKKNADGTIKKGIGNVIRDLSIDEFPQFFNVLKGDMSLVGTRPPTVDEWDSYDYHHRARLAAKPGLTGLWQVSGRSQITDFEEVVELDTKYITEWSLKLDIKILCKTVRVVLRREGAM